MNASWNGALALALLAGAAAAEEAQDRVQIELRVVASEAGRVRVDRGSADGLAVGDRVRLVPREGLPAEGRVQDLDPRGARVELDDPARLIAVGVRGEAWVARPAPAPQPVQEDAPRAPVEHPPWGLEHDAWRQGLPLLSEVDPLRPAQRPARTSGRWTVLAEHVFDLGGERSSRSDRAGIDVLYQNPFGNGADVLVAGEIASFSSAVPDADDQSQTLLRLDRLAYVSGGHRFAPERWAAGRFLQYGMSEFGVLDGVEWSRRTDGGDEFGASLGFLPEFDTQHESLDDLALAAWYRWVADESRRTQIQAGFQKTFHELAADRDLFVARFDLESPRGWGVHGTAWLDLYGASDTAKGAGVELTQALLSLGKRFEGGSSLQLAATRGSFAETERHDFTPVDDARLADAHHERVALRGRQRTDAHFSLYEELGAWSDEEEQGFDAEAGLELEDALGEGGFLRLGGFLLQGDSSDALGVRCALGRSLADGRWELGYEWANHDFAGFASGNDDLPQHRLRLARDYHGADGWSFSVHVEGVSFDDESSVVAGFYLQRSF